MGKLTEMAIKNFKVPDDVGKHSDGGGLYLIVSKTGGKSWRFRYEIKAGGKRIENCFWGEVIESPDSINGF